MALEPLLSHVEPGGKIPPVDQWNPEHSGDMDLVIRSDGTWIHEGAPIQRPRLLRLLSTLLRREADGAYCLVTPVEKMHIRVEDRPFLIVDAEPEQSGEVTLWHLTTNMGDRLDLGHEHRLVVSQTPEGEPVPEVSVRFGLGARFNRNVYYRLVELAEHRQVRDQTELGLVSQGVWQPLGVLDAGSS
ncbi:hypothetical protein SAMN02745148_02905 [Modicisalibacter ilicicola DSM 19980]|uniref:DUF1285 domain-containing protein n=1 Tax=Modicisalibacter ilicicola DSM 19980 TaxID=1121942 RepID=A0A1M5CGK0_9GAMM|nr:DUF1285 domain-containing protein [Halomonas ilicicola]SHF53826.1 hypothetical protein SAMN02745148_02905 [Halomonas ilicicola DSM 19980]